MRGGLVVLVVGAVHAKHPPPPPQLPPPAAPYPPAAPSQPTYDVVSAVCAAASAEERLALVNRSFGRAGSEFDIAYNTIFDEVTCAVNADGEQGTWPVDHIGSAPGIFFRGLPAAAFDSPPAV